MCNDIAELPMKTYKNIVTDPSVWFLVLSNAVTIFFAIKEHWTLSNILWPYWFQGITIGLLNILRILQFTEFYADDDGPATGGHVIKPSLAKRIFVAFLFFIHYMGLHIFLLLFFSGGNIASVYGTGLSSMTGAVLLTSILFSANHIFSYLYHLLEDTKKPTVSSLLSYPFARVLPMYLVIIFGFPILMLNVVLPFFLALKTLLDVFMHVVEHGILRKDTEVQAS